MSADLAAIRARLSRATPGPWFSEWQECDNWWSIYGAPSGEYVCPEVATVEQGGDAEADLIAHAPTDLAELVAEVERLTRWKSEAWPVMEGMQDLGKALGLRLGERITGPAAIDAAAGLRARAEASEAAVARVRDLAHMLSGSIIVPVVEDAALILAALDGPADA